jgi:fumarylpyruvate hydrolase
MSYVFPPAAQVSVPVVGSDALFPVRRVYCVGRNYAAHAAEMGADSREPPFFFSKPADALVPGGGDVTIRRPPAICSTRSNWWSRCRRRRRSAGAGPRMGLWLRRRSRSDPARPAAARPRTRATPGTWARVSIKARRSAPSIRWPASVIPSAAPIWLKVNGQLRQNGDLAQMSWKVAEVIANLSTYVELAPGDLIFTGTPAGVSTVQRGDVLEAVSPASAN